MSKSEAGRNWREKLLGFTQTPGILWVAAGAALWGTDTVFRRPLTATLSPVQLVFYEHCILAVLVLPIVLKDRNHLAKLTLRSWLALAVIAWLGSVVGTVLFTYAVRDGSPTTAVLLQKIQPIFAAVLARGLLGERWDRRFPFVVVAAILGAYLISFGSGSLLAPWSSVDAAAAFLAVGAAGSWGAATVFGRYLTAQLPFEMVTSLRFLMALPVLGAAVVYQGAGTPSQSMFLPITLIALVPGFAGLMLYYRGLRSTAAAHASVAELAFPATATLLNWLVLGVTASLIQIAGLAIVWASIFYLGYGRVMVTRR